MKKEKGNDIQSIIKEKRLELYLLQGKLREAKLLQLKLVEPSKGPVPLKRTLDVTDDELETIASLDEKLRDIKAEINTFSKRIPVEKLLINSGHATWLLFGFIGFFAIIAEQPLLGFGTWLVGFITGLFLHALAEIVRLLTTIKNNQ